MKVTVAVFRDGNAKAEVIGTGGVEYTIHICECTKHIYVLLTTHLSISAPDTAGCGPPNYPMYLSVPVVP